MPSTCPRCGSELVTFTLGGAEALSCGACGYVGVEADHSGEPTELESWEEAISRFEESLRERANGASNGDVSAEDGGIDTDHENEGGEADRAAETEEAEDRAEKAEMDDT